MQVFKRTETGGRDGSDADLLTLDNEPIERSDRSTRWAGDVSGAVSNGRLPDVGRRSEDFFSGPSTDDMPWRAKDLLDDDELDVVTPPALWQRIGPKSGVAIVAVLALLVAVAVQVNGARNDSDPWCRSTSSDGVNGSIGDGAGWEDGRTCRIRADESALPQEAPPVPLSGSAPATTATAPESTPTTAVGPPTTSADGSTTAVVPAEGSEKQTAASTADAANPSPAAPGSATRTPAPATASSGSYQSNLAMLRAQSVRNRNEDGSPFRSTPSAQLRLEDHLGPRSDYLNNPGGNPEQSFPVAEGGQFREGCEFSHFGYDDPIVYPGQPGASHLHMFFGNTDTNAYSTSDSILNTGSSTCNGQELNRTAYWAPALFDGNGNVRIPERIVVYYKGEGLANGKAEMFPEGAAMIAKTDLNTVDNGRGGAAGKFSFVCADNYSGPSQPASNTMLGCDGSAYKNAYGADDPHMVLEMNVKFPQCWNGKDASNPANYAAPTEGGWYFSNCTGEFSHTLVNLEYFIDYPVAQGENTADWYLSSDVDPTTRTRRPGPAGATVHADWWTGWNKQVNQMFLDNCVNFRTSEPSGCGFGYLTNGGPDGSNPLPGPALKYRQQYTGGMKVPASQLFGELCPGGGNLANAAAAAYCKPDSAVVRASLATTSLFCQLHPGMAAAVRPNDERSPVTTGGRTA